MYTIDRLNLLLRRKGMISPLSVFQNLHGALDWLDEEEGIKTYGNPHGPKVHGGPITRNTVGERIAIHERHAGIKSGAPLAHPYRFKEGDRVRHKVRDIRGTVVNASPQSGGEQQYITVNFDSSPKWTVTLDVRCLEKLKPSYYHWLGADAECWTLGLKSSPCDGCERTDGHPGRPDYCYKCSPDVSET